MFRMPLTWTSSPFACPWFIALVFSCPFLAFSTCSFVHLHLIFSITSIFQVPVFHLAFDPVYRRGFQLFKTFIAFHFQNFNLIFSGIFCLYWVPLPYLVLFSLYNSAVYLYSLWIHWGVLFIYALFNFIDHFYHSFEFNIWDFIHFTIIQNLYFVIVDMLWVKLLFLHIFLLFMHCDLVIWTQVTDGRFYSPQVFQLNYSVCSGRTGYWQGWCAFPWHWPDLLFLVCGNTRIWWVSEICHVAPFQPTSYKT
jgi:hypothetical protein